MNNTVVKIIIIICFIVFSLLFLKNFNAVKDKIATQDIVLDLVRNHDRYHNIYMEQFCGQHNKAETKKIIEKVYLSNSEKILNPQVKFGDVIIKSKEDLLESEEYQKYEKFDFSYNKDNDLIVVKGIEELEGDSNE